MINVKDALDLTYLTDQQHTFKVSYNVGPISSMDPMPPDFATKLVEDHQGRLHAMPPGWHDQVPFISAGKHPRYAAKACTMEMVSILLGDKWTDKPIKVNRELTGLVILANDGLDDFYRQELLKIIPFLMRANAYGPEIDEMIKQAQRAMIDLRRTRKGNWIVENKLINPQHALGIIDEVVNTYVDMAKMPTPPPRLENDQLRQIMLALAA